jgi:hypothetical protein
MFASNAAPTACGGESDAGEGAGGPCLGGTGAMRIPHVSAAKPLICRASP